METKLATLETSLVTSVTTKPASATPAASASSRPSAPAEGQPPASANNPPASAGPLASASPQPSVQAEGQPIPAGDYHPPLTAVSRPTQVGRASDATSRGDGELPTSPAPKILIISCQTKKLSSLSPFQRKEGCDRFGKVSRCDKLRDGGLEVEFLYERDAKRALTATDFLYTTKDGQGRRLVKLPITVSVHRTKNFSRGVIFCPDLEDVSDDDIAEGLSDFGVVAARRIRSRKAGVTSPTHNVILTFNQLDMPREVFVGYVRVRVRTYIPNPMRCFRCLRFGHTRDNCRNRPTCGNCAANDHTGDECTAETKRCVNCDSSQTPHSAFDRTCPALQREKEIISIKYTERVTFREAREKYHATHPKRSYASVVKETRPEQPEVQRDSLITELISILQSFGLKLVGSPGAPPDSTAPPAPQPAAAASETTASTQTTPTGDDGGWTLVRGRRGSIPNSTTRAGRETSPPPPPPTSPKPVGSAVTEALRRGEEDRRAREARRARLAEKAREAKRPPEDDVPPSANPVPAPHRTPTTGGPPPMGPPPPPPPLGRPPPPPREGATEEKSTGVPHTTQKATHPPAQERASKRALPWEGSPTDGGSPRARQRFQPGPSSGRSSSADGRQPRGHARIQFEQRPWPGAAEFF